MMQDVSLKLNQTLWEKAMAKMKSEFKKNKIMSTDFILILILLGLYKKVDIKNEDYIYLATTHPDQRKDTNYFYKTIAIHKDLLAKIATTNYYSHAINILMAAYIISPIAEYTDQIKPLYTIVGYKNITMQQETASAVGNMQLHHHDMTLVDACCATGSLFFGLNTYDWKQVILNDLNPLRTNFLNVLKLEPLKLIDLYLENDLSFIKNPDTKNPKLKEYKYDLDNYREKRKKYHKVDCNIMIAYEMFITQCIDKQHIENVNDIFVRMLRFLPAHLKLIMNETYITQEDCKKYLVDSPTITLPNKRLLKLDSNRLLLLDPPYVGTEHQCSAYDNNDKYKAFHSYVADCLGKAKYPFLYYCRSSPSKNINNLTPEEAKHIMKQRLSDYFFDRNFYFNKIYLDNNSLTELMISNKAYNPTSQFQWTDISQNIL